MAKSDVKRSEKVSVCKTEIPKDAKGKFNIICKKKGDSEATVLRRLIHRVNDGEIKI